MHAPQTASPTIAGIATLTDREKQTLRLLLDGHDAKSMARHLGLSVHTINERLREARRKLSVSSSKEAARLLRQAEADTPEKRGANEFGDAGPAPAAPSVARPSRTPPTHRRAIWAIGGLVMIAFFAALLALSAPAGDTVATTAAAEVTDPAAESAALNWLALVDDGRWQQSWAGTTRAFQSQNTVAAWQAASEKARVPFGRVLSRRLLDQADVPAPPNGYRMVRFRTDFANRRGATETLSLDREGDAWKIAGIYIE